MSKRANVTLRDFDFEWAEQMGQEQDLTTAHIIRRAVERDRALEEYRDQKGVLTIIDPRDDSLVKLII